MQSDLRSPFIDIVLGNETIRALVDRLAELRLPDCYLAAGCLCQTVWNHVSGFPPAHGITDYDIFYCDPSDLSWEGEDQVIRRCAAAFADLHADVQVRNQARVHLWHPEKFGVPHRPLHNTREGINGFLTRCSAHGLRKTASGGYDVYAPFGFDDVFAMAVRPNYVHDLPWQYREKADRGSRPGLASRSRHGSLPPQARRASALPASSYRRRWRGVAHSWRATFTQENEGQRGMFSISCMIEWDYT